MPFSRGYFWPRDWSQVSHIASRFFTIWTTRETQILLSASLSSVQFGSDTQSCLTLCDLIDCSTPGFPNHHQFLEITQTHVHQVSDAMQPSHPLTSLSPAAINLSRIRVFFSMTQFFASSGQNIGASASALVLLMNIQDWFPLGFTGRISLLSKGLSRVFSNTIFQKRQFFSAQISLWSSSHMIHDYWKNHSFD